jgi:membrane protease YdiL (CAAX protease family)
LSLTPNPFPELPVPAAPAPAAPELPVEDPPWTVLDVLLLGIAAAITVILSTTIAVVVNLVIYSMRHPGQVLTEAIIEKVTYSPYVLVLGQGIGSLVALAVMAALVRRHYRRPFLQSLRWNWPSLGWPGYFLGGIALSLLVLYLQQFLDVPKSLPINRYFETPAAAYSMAALGIFIAPLIEEFYFRGFLYPALARGFARLFFHAGANVSAAAKLGMAASVIITAGSFAAIHAGQLAYTVQLVAVLFAVGLVITLARAITGSLAAGILIHVGYNAALFLLLYIGTDRFRHLERLSQ